MIIFPSIVGVKLEVELFGQEKIQLVKFFLFWEFGETV